MRIFLVACIALGLSGPAFAQSLTGNQIRQMLVGHTISGTENGEAYSEYLNPNGTIAGKSGSDTYTGKWRISENEICFFYDQESKDWDCSVVNLRGNQITWDDGKTATLNGPGLSSNPGAAPGAAGPGPSYRRTIVRTTQPPAGPVYETGAPTAYWAPAPCVQPRGLFGGFGGRCGCSC